MAIGNDGVMELDDIDSFEGDVIDADSDGDWYQEPPVEEKEDDSTRESSDAADTDYVTEYLRSKGIGDPSRIKFEDDGGNVEERDWNSLDDREKINIIANSNSDPDTDLDDDEIELINAIRLGGMTPKEYLQKIKNDGVNDYLSNQDSGQRYEVDDFGDDELFVYDFISRMGDVTDDEAQEALERAKANPALYAKQISAIRQEYKQAEDENNAQAREEQQAQAQEQFNQFADQVADQVDGLVDFQGYDLNMDDEDKQTLYDFITGVDGAGVNHFAKALSDPKTLVRTAWLALNGEQMINDITSYFQKEISNVRRESYNKGKADALRSTNGSNVVYRQRDVRNNNVYDDLD